MLPWDLAPGTAARAADADEPRFADAVRLGERDELVARQFDAALASYRRALAEPMKYSGASRVVEMRLAREGHEAVIAVTDRGLGIAPAEHARIFEKFYRVGGAERDRIPGTGLGLTLVDHIVRSHGGVVTVRSASGEGRTFSIRLPLPDADTQAPAPEKAFA